MFICKHPKKIILPVIILGFTLNSIGQEAKVKNVDIDIEKNKIIVNYDLIGNDIANKHYIELFFIDDRYSVQVPKKLSGDFGEGVSPGLNKRIEWDVFTDDVAIAQKLQPKIVVNGIQKGGSINALYSILVPGLGDYFVKDSKSMVFKPYMRTISTLGLIGLGITAKQNREIHSIMSVEFVLERYDSDNDGDIDRQDATRTVEKPIIIGQETKYWLFPNDKELFLISGITLWVADVIWVFVKGAENEKLKMFSNYSFNANVSNGITNFSLSFKF